VHAPTTDDNLVLRIKHGFLTGTRKDTQFQVVSVQGNQFSVKKDTSTSSKPSSKEQPDQAAAQSKQDEFEKSKSYPFEIVPVTKRKDPDSFEITSGAFHSEVNASEDAAGVFSHASHDVMPSPRQTLVGPSSKLEVQGPVSPAPVDMLSSFSASSATKQRKKSKVKVAVSFDDKMLNSTLRAALQFLCDITCKSNKYLDYQRLFMTENTLKYLIQVVQILGQSEKLLHQEIAVVAVKYVCKDATC
jgi:hypothetical protein